MESVLQEAFVGGIVGIFGVLVFGWIIGVSPKKEKEAEQQVLIKKYNILKRENSYVFNAVEYQSFEDALEQARLQEYKKA